MIYFISDTHFGHSNIIKYCNRPYSSVEEMNEKLIDNWNKVICKADIVYCIGDFGFGRIDYLKDIFNKLNGSQKILIKGNHDKESCKLGWSFVKEYYELAYLDKCFIMHHYPYMSWNRQFHGSISLHGHIHSKYNQKDKSVLRFDVGVDANEYSPVSIDSIVNIVASSQTSGEIQTHNHLDM